MRINMIVAGCAVAMMGARAQAVIVYGGSNNDLSPNTTTPVTISTNGYTLDQYEGSFGLFLGTVISPTDFVTANHISPNTPTGTFYFANGTDSNTAYSVQRVGVKDDLAIWQIVPTSPAHTFSIYAPLYTGPNEIHQPMLVLGNGTERAGATTGGWLWGGKSSYTSWGTNVVSATPNSSQIGTPAGFGGSFLQFTFYPSPSSSNEAIISTGDSGGGVFVQDPNNGIYEFDGVNSLVDQVYDSAGNPVDAALYDDEGYYADNSGLKSELITSKDAGPLSSYATSISSRIGFVDSVTGLPEPTGLAVIAVVLPMMARLRRF